MNIRSNHYFGDKVIACLSNTLPLACMIVSFIVFSSLHGNRYFTKDSYQFYSPSILFNSRLIMQCSDLLPGDVVITHVQTDGTTTVPNSDKVCFIPLIDLPSGLEIKITDRGWDESLLAFFSNEGELTYTVGPLGLTAGSEVCVFGDGDIALVGGIDIVGDNIIVSDAGYALANSTGESVALFCGNGLSSPNLITLLMMDDAWDVDVDPTSTGTAVSEQPMNIGQFAQLMGTSDNFEVNCSDTDLVTSGTFSEIQSNFYNLTIDTFSNSIIDDLSGPNCSFTISSNPVPDVSGRDTTICIGSSVELEDLIEGNPLGALEYGDTFGNYPDTITISVTPTNSQSFFIRDSIRTNGCIDTALITITVIDTSQFEIDSTICQGDLVTFNGADRTVTGTYRDTLDNALMCDSFVVLNLTVNDTSHFVIDSTICQGELVSFNDEMLTMSGTYRDTLENAMMCDSFVVLNLIVNDTSQFVIDSTICQGEVVSFNSETLTMSGTYRDTLENAMMCDSFVVLKLIVNDTSQFVIDSTICLGEMISFNGEFIGMAGTYRDTLSNSNMCDSFIVLNLITELCCEIGIAFADTICNLDGTYQLSFTIDTSYVSGSEAIVSIGGTNVDTVGYPSMNGGTITVESGMMGDGSIGIELIVRDHNPHAGIFISEIHYDDNGTDTLEGYEITGPTGIDLSNYKMILYNGNTSQTHGELGLSGVIGDAEGGCGAIYFLDVLQNGSPDGLALVTSDESKVLEFISYEGVITAANGPASGVTSDDIGVSETTSTAEHLSLQKTDAGWGGPIGMTQDAVNADLSCPTLEICADTIMYNAPTCIACTVDIAGRDTAVCIGSAVLLSELLNGSIEGSVHYGLSIGSYTDTITQIVTAITTQTYYIQDTVNGTGCVDTAIITITVNDTSHFEIDSTICQGEIVSFNGENVSVTGTYRDTLENALMCDSSVVLNLIVNDTTQFIIDSTVCQGEVVSFNGETLTMSGTYRDTLENAMMCDSFVVLNLTVNDTSQFVIDSTICLGEMISFNGEFIGMAGTYRDTLSNSNMCDSFIVLNLITELCCEIDIAFADTICNLDGTYQLSFTIDTSYVPGSEAIVSIGGTNVDTVGYPSMNGGTITVESSMMGDGSIGIELIVRDHNPHAGIFISEIHYDDNGTDTLEGYEITGPTGIDLSNYKMILYNGNTSQAYGELGLSGVIGDAGGGCGAIYFSDVLQNGSPDGLALVTSDESKVLEFISYEGVITATNGPASGMSSDDIGVSETTSTAEHLSLQKTDAGWGGPIGMTQDAVNADLICPTLEICADTIMYNAPTCNNSVCLIEASIIDSNCNPDGTYDLRYSIRSENSLSSAFAITSDDSLLEIVNYPVSQDDTLIITLIRATSAVQLIFSDTASTESVNDIFISEIHYDNSGTDENEGVEITGPSGMYLNGFQILFYNGSNGLIYNTTTLAISIPNSGSNCSSIFIPIDNMQNGPDAIALITPSAEVLEFISYEGSFVAIEGPAIGMRSEDIEASESSSNDVNNSLQLSDMGWSLMPRTPSLLNARLSCRAKSEANICADTLAISPSNCPIYDLALEKTFNGTSGDFVNPGDTIEFLLKVINQSEATVYDIIVHDSVPEDLSFEPAINDVNWSGSATYNSIASIESGADTTINIFLIVNTDFEGSSILNVAIIEAATESPGGITIVDVDNASIGDHISVAPIFLCGDFALPDPILEPIAVCRMDDNTVLIAPIRAENRIALIEDFETDGGGSRYFLSDPEFSDGQEDYFIRSDGTNTDVDANDFTNISGSYWFGAQDLNGELGNEVRTITFQQSDIRGLAGLELSLLIAEDDDASNEDFDNQPSDQDFVHIDYSIDGGSFINGIHVEPSAASGANSAPAIDADYDGIGEGAWITDTFANFVFAIPEVGSVITIRITVSLDDGGEDIALDDIQVIGPKIRYNFYDSDTMLLSLDAASYDLPLDPNAIETRVFVQTQWNGCFGDLFPLVVQQHPVNESLVCHPSINLNVDASCSIEDISSSIFYTSDIHPNFIIRELRTKNGEIIDPSNVSAYFDKEIIYEITDTCSSIACWGNVNLVAKHIPDPIISHDTLCCLTAIDIEEYVDMAKVADYLAEGCNARYENLRRQLSETGSLCDTLIYKIEYLADFIRDATKNTSVIGIDSVLILPILAEDVMLPGSDQLGNVIALRDTITIKACNWFDTSPKGVAAYWAEIHDPGDQNDNGIAEGIPFAYPFVSKDSVSRLVRRINIITDTTIKDSLIQVDGLWIQAQVVVKDTLIDTTYIEELLPNYIALEEGKTCNWDISYTDQYYDACFDNSKLLRTWKLLDWCSATLSEHHQWIRYEDTEAPDFNVIQVNIDFVTQDSILINGVPVQPDSINVQVEIDLTSILRIIDIDNGAICEARIEVPVFPELVDNCTSYEELTFEYKIDGWPAIPADGFLEGFPDGSSILETTATDECGNYASHEMTIIALDRSAPEVHCRDAVNVTLIDDYGELDGGQARVYLRDLDLGTTDACNDIILILGQRLDNKIFCGDSLLTFIGTEYLEFCCEDAGQDIPISLTFFDAFGNTSKCWLEVHVDAKIYTHIETKDVYRGCHDDLDPEYTGFPEVSGVCIQEVLRYVDNYEGFNDQCGVGIVQRKWYIEDEPDNQAIQFIHIYPDSNYTFDPYSIKWPKHYTGYYVEDFVIKEWQGDTLCTYWEDTLNHYHCRENLALSCIDEVTDVPEWTQPKCGLIGVSHEDLEFNSGAPSCGSFIRSYTIIDWCTYESNEEEGILNDIRFVKDNCLYDEYYQYDTVIENGLYKYNQVIQIIDSIAPVLSLCEDRIVSANYNCQAALQLEIHIADDGVCGGGTIYWELELRDETNSLVLDIEGSDESGDSIRVTSQYLALGNYFAKWKIHDACKNNIYCEQTYTIVDNIGPELWCYEDLTTTFIDGDGIARIWAIDYILKASNNCIEDDYIQFVFDSSDLFTTYIELTCEEVSNLENQQWSGVIFALDSDGNWSTCNVNLHIQDNESICALDSIGSNQQTGKVSNRKDTEVAFDKPYLEQNKPNPFSQRTHISFYLPQNQQAQLSIYNQLGQSIYEISGYYKSGITTIELDESDLGSAGIYIYQLSVEGLHFRKRLLLID